MMMVVGRNKWERKEVEAVVESTERSTRLSPVWKSSVSKV